MGRDKTGKRQQEQQNQMLMANTAADRERRDREAGKYNKSVNALEASPGLGPSGISAAKNEDAALQGGLFGGEKTALTEHAAATGWGNDAGLAPQLEQATRQRSMATAAGDNNIALKDAQLALDTRRMLPGMRFAPASLYGGQATTQSGQAVQGTDARMQADQTTPLWAQMGMSATGGASQVLAARAGRT